MFDRDQLIIEQSTIVQSATGIDKRPVSCVGPSTSLSCKQSPLPVTNGTSVFVHTGCWTGIVWQVLITPGTIIHSAGFSVPWSLYPTQTSMLWNSVLGNIYLYIAVVVFCYFYLIVQYTVHFTLQLKYTHWLLLTLQNTLSTTCYLNTLIKKMTSTKYTKLCTQHCG